MKKDVVLLVDDDPSIRESVSTILEEEGIGVLIARNGQACLEILKKDFQGLILMDIMMDGIDGLDTIQKLMNKKLLQGSIVCMLTAEDVPDKRFDSMNEVVLDYIHKPFEKERLVSVVRHYLSYLK